MKIPPQPERSASDASHEARARAKSAGDERAEEASEK